MPKLLALFLVMVGIGLMAGGSAAARPDSGSNPMLYGCASPAKWHGNNRSNYVASCQICKLFGRRKLAREYNIRSSNSVTVALRYAQKSYRPDYRQAVFEGCLRGFRLHARG